MATKLKNLAEVETALREMEALRQTAKRARTAMEEKREAVKEYMERAQLSSFTNQNGTCSASLSKGVKRRFNAAKFADEHPRMVEQYLYDEEFNQLYFKVR